jgi:hypothetical protein
MNNTKTGREHRWLFRTLLSLISSLGAAAAVYFLSYLPRERTAKQLDAAAAARRMPPPFSECRDGQARACEHRIALARQHVSEQDRAGAA